MTSLIAKLNSEVEKNGLGPTAKKATRAVFMRTFSLLDKSFDRLLKTKSLDGWIKNKSQSLANDFSPKQAIDTSDYKKYIEAQITKSYKNSSYLRFWRFWGRTGLIEQLNKNLQGDRSNMAVLCVGCRDFRELNHVKKICGLKNITGLDLFSQDERIKIGDMHAMPFENASFDILISVDNLEHAYDAAKALSEFRRVVKKGGIIGIEVPVQYNTSDIDRQDFKSVQNLLQTAGINDKSAVIFEETFQGPTYQKIRVLVRNP